MGDASRNERSARVILIGPPGAGKGTQATRVASYLGVPRVSTGDLLREAIAKRTSLGAEAGPIMEKGGLVPDPLLMKLVQERLGREDCHHGYVLDGFPRTVGQAKGFETLLGVGDANHLVIFDMGVPRPELLRRLSGRRWCPTCQSTYHVDSNPPKRDLLCDRDGTPLIQREDDKEPAIARRLVEYEQQTAPVVDFYRDRSRYHQIDGNRRPEAVFGSLKEFLGDAR